jgi:hypothetical protein
MKMPIYCVGLVVLWTQRVQKMKNGIVQPVIIILMRMDIAVLTDVARILILNGITKINAVALPNTKSI